MSDYFNCPRCGYTPKPDDPRAKNEWVYTMMLFFWVFTIRTGCGTVAFPM